MSVHPDIPLVYRVFKTFSLFYDIGVTSHRNQPKPHCKPAQVKTFSKCLDVHCQFVSHPNNIADLVLVSFSIT